MSVAMKDAPDVTKRAADFVVDGDFGDIIQMLKLVKEYHNPKKPCCIQ